MAQLPPRPAAGDAAAWEEEEQDLLDVDDSDIRLDAPAPSPVPRSCATPHSHHRHVPELASAVEGPMRRRLAAGPPVSSGRAEAKAPDPDFLLPPWLCALQFLGKGSAWEQPGIKVIKSEEELCRAPLVAGVVTSCKPNGLGDLLVTVKDPSGTIAASVHKKVVLKGNNDHDISVGCVIVLSQVAVFRPTYKACYLNITKVTKVIRNDCDALSKKVTCSQLSSLSGSTVMFGDTYSTQAADSENLRRHFSNENMLHISKKLKSDAVPPGDSGETANSRIDTEDNCALQRNMNTELGMPEQLNGQRSSIKESIEHQQKDNIAVNAGSAQPTKDCATDINGSLLNPRKTLSVASAEWTDEQVYQLFADY